MSVIAFTFSTYCHYFMACLLITASGQKTLICIIESFKHAGMKYDLIWQSVPDGEPFRVIFVI